MAWGKCKDPRVAFERGIDVSMLSSTGLGYRRCELVRVNSSEIGVRFLRAEHPKSKHVHRSAAPARTLQAGSGRRPRPPKPPTGIGANRRDELQMGRQRGEGRDLPELDRGC